MSVAALARTAVAAGFASALLMGSAAAQVQITYKSARSTSSYYQMAVQIAEAVRGGSDGAINVTVEESQGSVQNVGEAAVRTDNYVFTAPPGLVASAVAGTGQFEPQNPAFGEIRGLFPIPALTMHFVARADTGIVSFTDLAGHDMLIGSGSFGARESERYLELFGILDEVALVEIELNAAVPALQNGQIDAFATAGSYPAPNVIQAATATEITLISLSEEQVEATGRTRLVIPGGTYPHVNNDIVTTTLPVMAYTTTVMDDETAYELTRLFWENREAMAETAPWWGGVSTDLLAEMPVPLHAGAIAYYDEIGVELPDALR